ncbi:hypothetical protein [Peribacillus sp. CSMR9]|uniref:hypothetical protein n=1 Tax=Peribacillus sp. CSMR9 TaxID=2981350 RepID=UPI0029545EAA|nr:hypothetical protein [Peribacillus sp. CSMR9]MDV7764559.1 hypothetical protein [Peribacillus sp. CSMR9]
MGLYRIRIIVEAGNILADYDVRGNSALEFERVIIKKFVLKRKTIELLASGG